ncbi:4-amino-4-deoxy-L-arabinose transferase-like glycosyltransferase [Chitinivorax tropicus]|uniref:4-amino-4-deoxy-L-arabinose transferase-like glycosyltransferase n=1 Tax=Chitinivorax tropicus TaxID=714531 RepID=A0A840MJ62_9PROT|nr:4-amino-4-deoxy-L-arabinose transferase-like glycosyltransferase [Chitinivorax tropicus]
MFESTSKRSWAALLILFAALWFGQLDFRKLVKPDEGRYAEISREMVVSGDWVTPRLNDLKYFEKPPMQYWATALAYEIFGETEWTARLWTGLSGFIGILLAVYAGSVLFGRRAGLITGLVLGGSLYYLALGHINTLDMGVSLFLELALIGFLMAHRDQASPRSQRNWMMVVWFAMAGAMLSKGLIGLVIPGMALILYMLLTRQWSLLARMHWLPGLALFALIVLPWFVLVSQRNPEFLQFFFIHEHFQRFATDNARRDGAIWYFIPLLILGITPWASWLGSSLWQAKTKTPQQTFQPKWMLLIWSAFIFIFFSISKSKLPAYILPMFPAVALLMGDHLARQTPAQIARHAGWLALLSVPMCVFLIALPHVQEFGSEETPASLIMAYATWIQAGAVTGVIGFVMAWRLARKNQALDSLVAIGMTGAIVASLILNGHNELAPSNSSYHFAQQLKGKIKPNVPFFSVNTYDQTLTFYLKRTMTLVNYTDEMALGIQQEPHKAIPQDATFQALWQSLPEAYALMTPGRYEEIVAQTGLPMKVLARDTRRIVVSKP